MIEFNENEDIGDVYVVLRYNIICGVYLSQEVAENVLREAIFRSNSHLQAALDEPGTYEISVVKEGWRFGSSTKELFGVEQEIKSQFAER